MGNVDEMKGLNKSLIIVIAIILVIIVIMSSVVYILATPSLKYRENWIIGKSYDEIAARYGEGDIVHYENNDPSQDVVSVMYLVKEERVLFFGTSPKEFYKIIFEDGKAVEINKKAYLPGG